jgi:hypothetical protein
LLLIFSIPGDRDLRILLHPLREHPVHLWPAGDLADAARGATNRIAKAYVENVFIWNAWPILYGGFGALLSAVQMGQVGQMLSQNSFLGGLGNLEGSVLIGIASIIYSLAIAVIPFMAKRIVSGDVGATAVALVRKCGPVNSRFDWLESAGAATVATGVYIEFRCRSTDDRRPCGPDSQFIQRRDGIGFKRHAA